MLIDNSDFISRFVPEHSDGDTFLYTEMLDRSKTKGNNGQRLMKTFYHRTREEFWNQLPLIKRVCDMSQVRAMTRLSPRSFEMVAHTNARLILEALIAKNHAGVKTLYQKACGTTSPIHKVWIWDIDVINDQTECFRDALTKFEDHHGQKVFLGTLPSKKGFHHLTRPFDASLASDYMRICLGIEGGLKPNGEMISLHKDNPTNLYIPNGAA
jgi:hypothetical protein